MGCPSSPFLKGGLKIGWADWSAIFDKYVANPSKPQFKGLKTQPYRFTDEFGGDNVEHLQEVGSTDDFTDSLRGGFPIASRHTDNVWVKRVKNVNYCGQLPPTPKHDSHSKYVCIATDMAIKEAFDNKNPLLNPHGDMRGKPWNDIDRLCCKLMWKSTYNLGEIAYALGRTVGSIACQLQYFKLITGDTTGTDDPNYAII